MVLPSCLLLVDSSVQLFTLTPPTPLLRNRGKAPLNAIVEGAADPERRLSFSYFGNKPMGRPEKSMVRVRLRNHFPPMYSPNVPPGSCGRKGAYIPKFRQLLL
jgi:hypothetical protein